VNTPTVSKASVGTKRKAAEQNVGRRRKAPKRTITHFDFPNYGHLEIIPRKPEDVTHSFHDVSKLSEFSRPRQFFKKSPIPEEYKKRCANKTTRLNLTLTGSFGKRAGAVSKRRSSVYVSALPSIILPPRVDQQTDNWVCVGEELAGGTKGTASGSKSSSPRMVDGSTFTDQGVVSMTVEEFNQVLNLVASGIQLASANTRGIAVQEEKTYLLRKMRQRIM